MIQLKLFEEKPVSCVNCKHATLFETSRGLIASGCYLVDRGIEDCLYIEGKFTKQRGTFGHYYNFYEERG